MSTGNAAPIPTSRRVSSTSRRVSARLQTQVAEGFRCFEFDLRRKLGAAGADQLLLGSSDNAPASYKALVEEYYRTLARDRKK